MQHSIQEHRREIEELCRTFRVRRLAVFGSAASDGFDDSRSDIDLLVEFLPLSPAEHAGAYFGLLAELERILRLPVDLVEASALKNPYIRRNIVARQEIVYEP